MDSLSKTGGLSPNTMCNIISGLLVHSGGLYNYTDVMSLRASTILCTIMFPSINFHEFSENHFSKILKFME